MVSIFFLNSGQVGHNMPQSTAAFTYNMQYKIQIETHKLQYVKTPKKFLVNKAVLLTSFSAQSIKTLGSYLT